MSKFTDWIERVLVPIGTKIASQRHLAAVRDGMTILIPVTIIGGFAILLAQPPVPDGLEATNFFYAFLLAWDSWASAHAQALFLPYYMTISIISIYVVVGVAYRMAKTYKLDGVNNVVSALMVFLIVSGAFDFETTSINISYLGAGYMFGAMIIAILVVEVNNFFVKKNIVIKMPDSVPPNVAAPFNMLIPLAVNVIGFSLLNSLCVALSGAGLTSLVFTIFQPLMKASDTLPSIILISLIVQTFWFFGIHGDNMVSAVVTPITTANLASNLEAYLAGETLPYIYAGSVGSIFGGWLCYNAIQLLMFTVCKSSQLKSLVKVSVIPSCFNINEPGVFGIPTVLNVYMYIGTTISRILNITVYYLLASAGIVGKFYMTIPWTTPTPIAAFLGTMDWRCVVLWAVLFVADYFIILPFIKIYDNQLVKQEAGE